MSSSCPPTDEEIAAASRDSLAFIGGGYVVGADGVLEYHGVRPAGHWHVHGWLVRWLWVLVEGVPERRRLRKRRWRNVETGRTCHSRPPDEWGAVSSCWLLVLLMLWPWLNGGAGLHNTPDLSDDLHGHVSQRTRQRWLRQACEQVPELQHAVRYALIERCEPRPVEQIFPKGLSPPESLVRRRWREPELVTSLHRALVLLFTGAVTLAIPTAQLLAEARGR